MTALDDALNSSSVTLGHHQLSAQWREAYSGEQVANPTDSVTDLTRLFSGEMTVEHSLEDALPDPVTMTGSADASGVFAGTLNGSDGLVVGQTGFRTWVNTQTTGNWDSGATATETVLVHVPVANAQYGDTILVAVLMNDAAATLNQTDVDPQNQWQFLGSVSDGTLSLHLYYKRRWNPDAPDFQLFSDKNVAWLAQSVIFWSTSPSGARLDYQLGEAVLLAEASSTTTHSVTSKLTARGYQIGFWGATSASGVITTTLPAPLGNPALNGLTLASGRSAIKDAGQYTATATQAAANAVMCMAAVSVILYERPRMNGREFWSEFNRDSPVYGFERDTADVASSVRIITDSGPVDTQIFKGQMQTIGLNGEQANMAAVSKTRIWMNRSVDPPLVNGYREGLTADWFISWLASRGSQFIGPSPNRYTRYWAPLHGSLHAHYGPPDSYNAAFTDTPTSGGSLGRKYPASITGPYHRGMFAQTNLTRTDWFQLRMEQNLRDNTDSPFPHVNEQGGPLNIDVFSLANSKGRVCFWIKADPWVNAQSYLGDDYVFRQQFSLINSEGVQWGLVGLYIQASDGRPTITMGNTNVGYVNFIFNSTGALTGDGQWHFYGFWWDYAGGRVQCQHNGNLASSTYWLDNGLNDTSGLPTTDASGKARGDKATMDAVFRLSASEYMYDSGKPLDASTPFADYYPAPTLPGAGMTVRRADQTLTSIAVPEAINVWDTLSEMCQSTLSAYRVNETDALEVLPMSYFGEAARMTSVATQDTRTNSMAMEPTTDASKTRNVVTVQFNDTRIDTKATSVLDWNTEIDLAPGTTIITFTLDVPAVEVHGAALLANTDFSIFNLTSAQITGTLPSDQHWITVNTANDGTGTYLDSTKVTASFVKSGTLGKAQSVTVQFVNRTTATAYLINNGNQVPFMRILGYGSRASTAYTTVRDSTAVVLRGERGLDSELDWIQDRTTANNIAGLILGVIGRPRPQMTFTVVGDPRRKPGDLVTVTDKDGTKVDGLWRVLAVRHDTSGAQYTQDLFTVQQLPTAVWDGNDGWDEGVWGE